MRGGRIWEGGSLPRGRNRSASSSGTTECRGRLVRSARGPTSVFFACGAVSATTIGGRNGSNLEHAAGLDVHQSSVVACVISGAAGRRASRETRTFGAMKRDLAELRAWLL